MKAPDILTAAAGHMAARAATYDKPEGERSMARTVAAFNALHGTSLTEAQGWHFMQLLKAVRLFQNPATYHADSAEDGVAYGALMGEAMQAAAHEGAEIAAAAIKARILECNGRIDRAVPNPPPRRP